MLALAVLIAVLAIVNTLLLSVQERGTEVGMLRAVGATRGQIRSMLVTEAAVLGLFGAVCGLLLGVGYGVMLRIVMAPLGITQLALPWGWLLGCAVGGALAGVPGRCSAGGRRVPRRCAARDHDGVVDSRPRRCLGTVSVASDHN